MGKRKNKTKFKPKARPQAEFLHNVKWTEIFMQEDDDQPEPIYGEMTHDEAET